MKKKIGYLIFSMFFSVFRLCPLNKNKVFIIATHDGSDEGNAGIVREELEKRMPEKKVCFLTRRDERRLFSFFIGKAFHMATSGTIFMDNHFLPMAYTPISKKAKVVQLWHGTGTIKKFGLDAESGEVAELARRANGRTTHLIVNSEFVRGQYKTAFGMPEERIHILGLPRTDRLLDESWMKKKRDAFFRDYPQLKGRHLVLYAPTFRDGEVAHPKIMLDFERLSRELPENTTVLLRLHPHVAGGFAEMPPGGAASAGETASAGSPASVIPGEKFLDVSAYRGVTTLLSVADCLVTDYSSILFEYCLLRRPVCFYAYDLEAFASEGRSFYVDYESYVPGPVVKTQDGLADFLNHEQLDEARMEKFIAYNYLFLDKKSVERLFGLIFS